MDMSNLPARKSQRCEAAACIFVAADGDHVVIGDGTTGQRFTRAEWDAFLTGAKAGEFDDIAA